MNKTIEDVLSRGVAGLVDPNNVFRHKLESKVAGTYAQDIVIKLGVDPTRPDIHIGHAVILRKLRQFQDLGCKVVFLVGDVTAQIGDPTGKSKVRPEISAEEVNRNMQTFLDHVGKILRTDDAVFSWITNSDWFMNVTDVASPAAAIELDGHTIDPNSFIGKAVLFENTRRQKTALGRSRITSVSLVRFLAVLRRITHARLIARDMFQERLARSDELYMHEMMYPVLQGIDSVALAEIYGSCDLEIGGTDQTFNMLMGRDVMKLSGLPEQSVMSLEILPGLDGVEKMSKSLDNYIAITDTPSEMYGKVMSVPDTCLGAYFRLATYSPLDEIERIEADLSKPDANPRDYKMRLAREIVAMYHGSPAAAEAEHDFIETFSKGGIPSDVESVQVSPGEPLVEILLSQGLIASKTEWRRLVEEGAVTNAENGERISSPDFAIEESAVFRVGKRRFIRVNLL